MDGPPGLDVLKLRTAMAAALLLLFCWSLTLSSSLNDEGLALLRIRDRVFRDPFGALSGWNADEEQLDPCSWFGVECSDGKVVSLNLKDLCLGGTLAPEIGELTHIKSIILRNNSFNGDIPQEISGLQELEVLDVGYNNFSGPVPPELGNNLSLVVLLLDNNEFITGISPELYELKMVSEYMADERQLAADEGRASCRIDCFSARNRRYLGKEAHQRRLLTDSDRLPLKTMSQAAELQTFSPSPSPSSSSPVSSPESSPSPLLSPQSTLSPSSTTPTPQSTRTRGSANPPSHNTTDLHNSKRVPAPASPPTEELDESSQSKNHNFHILVGVVSGSSIFALIAAVAIFFFRTSKVSAVKPWSTGLSGQLQKAFVSGVPKLNRSELEGACEDFSNIIDSFSGFTLYKGTLSSGVEIAVSTVAKAAAVQDWSENKETEFRLKIETLSRVNHKNFVNLIGYCEEEQPLTRMMVFEYAPNGTLFEHLHIKEAEHLDWGMRLRIAMGMSFCLEYMHQLNPPVHHRNLCSSTVYLTDDYAAKISDLSCSDEKITAKKTGSAPTEPMQTQLADSESNVHSFGLILLEMLTGRVPYCLPDGHLSSWVSDFLEGDHPLSEMVDPTLSSFDQIEMENLLDVIKQCTLAEPREKPTMKEITLRLKEITAMEEDAATPKMSPLWWAELEILSAEAN